MSDKPSESLINQVVDARNVVAAGTIGQVVIESHKHSTYVPRMAPPVSKLLTGREGIIQTLVSTLLLDPGTPGSPKIIALRGMGGIGKTTLAAALAHNAILERDAPDGTLWVSLGPEPDLMSLLGEWGEELGQDFSGYPSPQSRSHALSAILHEKSAFLVIDDVWRAEDADLFVVGGEKCCVLLTTRNGEVARAIAGRDVYLVETLVEEASLALLAKLAPNAVTSNKSDLRQLIEQLGGLPLGLVIAGRLLAEELDAGVGIQGILTELQAREKRLEMSARSQSLEAVLKMSYKWLTEEIYRKGFRLLGIFGGKPNTFSLIAAAVVCGIDLDTMRKVIVYLVNRALVEVAGEGRYALHALVADFALCLLGEDENKQACLRHAGYFLKIAQQYTADNMKEWHKFDADWSNIRLSANWLSTASDAYQMEPEKLELAANFGIALDVIVQARKPLEALMWLQTSETACGHLGRLNERGWLLLTIGLIELDKGCIDQAIDHFAQCERLFESLGDARGLIYARGNLGLVHHKRGEYQQALGIYEQITDMCADAKDVYGAAVGYYNQGDVYFSLGNSPKALVQLRKSISLCQEEDIQDLLVKALALNAKIHLESAEIEAAFVDSQQAYKIAVETGSNVLLGVAHQTLGQVLQSRGDVDTAKDHFEKSIGMLTEANVQEELAEAQVAYGNFLVHAQQHDQAKRFWSMAIGIFEQIGARSRAHEIASILKRLPDT